MDIIFIQGLKVDAIIGVYDWERATRQDIIFDIEMYYNNSAVTDTDNINQALNYHSVCDRISDYVRGSDCQLIETLAEKVCQIILNEFSAERVKLKLSKGEVVTGAQNVGVIVDRPAHKS